MRLQLVISILLLCTTLNAQLENVRVNPGVMLLDVQLLTDADVGYAVGNLGRTGMTTISRVLKTTDNGKSWSSLVFNDSANVSLSTVFFYNESIGWIAGSHGRIYKTVDGGLSWTNQNTGIDAIFRKIYFLNENLGYAVGEGNVHVVFKTEDGGATWENLSFGGQSFLKDVVFFDENIGYVSGAKGFAPVIYKTYDSGLNWVELTLPDIGYDSGYGEISSLALTSTGGVWASFSSIYSIPRGSILYSEDGGNDFQVNFHTGNIYNYNIVLKDDNSIAISSNDFVFSVSDKIFYSTNGGSQWSNFDVPFSYSVYGLAFKGDKILCTSRNSVIYSTDNYGHSFTFNNNAGPFKSIEWVTENFGIATGETTRGEDQQTFVTSDAGNTWISDASFPGGSVVTFTDENTGYFLRGGANASLLKTENAGESWDILGLPSTSVIESIEFVNDKTGWAFGSGGTILKTVDGGNSWLSQQSGTTNFIHKANFFDENNAITVGGFGGNQGVILKTTNSGDSWVNVTPNNVEHLMGLHFHGEQVGLAVGYNGGIYKTSDAGQSWNKLTTIPNNRRCKSVYMVSETRAFVSAYNDLQTMDGQGFIYETTDGGQTWHLMLESYLPESQFNDFKSRKGNDVWAVGQHQQIVKIDAETLSIVSFSNQNQLKIGNPYPNPASSFSKIDIEVSGNNDNTISVDVYDLNGRIVKSIDLGVLPNGTHTVEWNLFTDNNKKVDNGMYYFSINVNNNYRVVRPLIVNN